MTTAALSSSDQLLKILSDNLTQIDQNFDGLYQNATTDAQRQQLRATLTAARDAYWSAVASGLQDTNAYVMSLGNDLVKQVAQIKATLANLQNVVGFLALASEAVKLAAAIATLAAA